MARKFEIGDIVVIKSGVKLPRFSGGSIGIIKMILPDKEHPYLVGDMSIDGWTWKYSDAELELACC